MISIKQYKKIITDFFNRHLQINTVMFGTKSDFLANENVIYPAVNISYLDSGTNDSTITDRFQITIYDLQDVNNQDTEIDIIHNCTLIAHDVLNYLNDDEFSFTFQLSNITQILNFTDEGTDITSGVVFAINLSQQRIIDPCRLPLIRDIDDYNEGVFDSTFSDVFH